MQEYIRPAVERRKLLKRDAVEVTQSARSLSGVGLDCAFLVGPIASTQDHQRVIVPDRGGHPRPRSQKNPQLIIGCAECQRITNLQSVPGALFRVSRRDSGRKPPPYKKTHRSGGGMHARRPWEIAGPQQGCCASKAGLAD